MKFKPGSTYSFETPIQGIKREFLIDITKREGTKVWFTGVRLEEQFQHIHQYPDGTETIKPYQYQKHPSISNIHRCRLSAKKLK